jgi:hypothetical protein
MFTAIRAGFDQNQCERRNGGPSSSGNFAMFAAILRASSLLSHFAADHRPGSSSK